MKPIAIVLAAALSALAAGCARNLERSRDLGNPDVPAAVLARQVCSNCHGIGGNAVSPNFPNLAGQTEAYIASQLRGFKGHERRDPAGYEYMWGISRSLSDDQIKGLAAHFSALSPQVQPVEGEPARIAAGRSVFENGMPDKGVPACSSCHGGKGQGMATFPRIAGQHADYVAKQLMVFQRGDERPEGAIMKTIAHGLSRDDILNVASYLQAMPGLQADR